MRCLSPTSWTRRCACVTLSGPAGGAHAMQVLLDEMVAALATAWVRPVPVHRGPRVVLIADNYDRLYYPPDAVSRDSRYSRYVDAHRMPAVPRLASRTCLPRSGSWSAPRCPAGAGVRCDVLIALIAAGLPPGVSGLAMGVGPGRIGILPGSATCWSVSCCGRWIGR